MRSPKASPVFFLWSLSVLIWGVIPTRAASEGLDSSPIPAEEQKFFELYSKFQSQPTSEELWNQSQKNNPALSYELKEGDNLWDLSQVLFGDAQFWPKLWSINSQSVTNPHEVRRGARLLFVPGGDQAPELQILSSKDAALAAGSTESSSPTAEKKGPAPEPTPPELVALEVPPPAKVPAPLRGLPQSLPAWSFRQLPEDIGSVDLQRKVLPWAEVDEVMPFQVLSSPPAVSGRVVETEYRGDFGMDQSEVLVHLKSPPSGSDLLVIQPGEKIYDPFRKVYVYERRLVGELRVVGSVNSRLQVYRARVNRSILPVQRGAEVVEGKLPLLVKPSSKASTDPNSVVRVLGGPLNAQTRYRGEKQYVFLSGGEAQGLRAGDVFGIQKFSKARNPLTLIEENESVIARVLIAHVEAQVATGFILDSSEEVLIGDRLSALRPESAPRSDSSPSSSDL